MRGSRLFQRVFLVVSLLVVANSLVLYLTVVPSIRESTYRQEERSARTILDSVYTLVRAEHQHIEAYKRSALLAYKRLLRNVVEIQHSYIRSKLRLVEQGKLDEQTAKKQTLETLRKFRYGNNDYVWVADYASVLISHPDPKLHNADFSRVRDIKRNLIVPPMVAIARRDGEGYHSYWWRRLGAEKPVEKLTYVRHFPRWKWVIGSGVYVDDVARVVQKRRRGVLEELRQILKGLKIGKTGYMYIFDASKQMLVHPNPQLEGKNITGMLNPVTNRPIADELMAAAKRPDHQLDYRWDRPDDAGNYVYDKVSWVKHFAGFDWYLASSVYVDELKESSIVLGNRILLLSAVVLFFSVGLSLLFIRRLLRPIEDLSALAVRVKRGDLEARSGIDRRDEIGVLAQVFDQMVERLRKNITDLDRKVAERTEELAHKNEALQESLERLERAQEKLVASEQRAVAANRAKSVFLANMSHELRTPLNAIIGYSEMIAEDAREAGLEDVVSDLEKIRAAGRHLLALINDILDLSRIEAGKIQVASEPFDLGEMVDAVVATVQPQAHANGSQLLVERAADLGPMRSDPVRIRQILLNLLSNACKFTRKGEIRFTVRRDHRGDDGDRLTFEVADTGIGIAEEKLERLFDPFYQADDSTTREYGGTGLGLAISQKFARMLGGEITVTSELGVGSTFTATFPVEREEERPA